MATPFTGAWGDIQLALTNVVVQSIPDLSKEVSDAQPRRTAGRRHRKPHSRPWTGRSKSAMTDDRAKATDTAAASAAPAAGHQSGGRGGRRPGGPAGARRGVTERAAPAVAARLPAGC